MPIKIVAADDPKRKGKTPGGRLLGGGPRGKKRKPSMSPDYKDKKKKKNKLVYDIFTKNLDKFDSFSPERIKTITQKAKPHSSREGRLSVLKREIDPLYEDAKKRAKMCGPLTHS